MAVSKVGKNSWANHSFTGGFGSVATIVLFQRQKNTKSIDNVYYVYMHTNNSPLLFIYEDIQNLLKVV